MESFPSFFLLLCKCGGHHLLCSPGAWPALSMSHVSMTSSGMKRGEQSGSPHVVVGTLKISLDRLKKKIKKKKEGV